MAESDNEAQMPQDEQQEDQGQPVVNEETNEFSWGECIAYTSANGDGEFQFTIIIILISEGDILINL